MKVSPLDCMRFQRWLSVLSVTCCVLFTAWPAWSETAMTTQGPVLSASVDKDVAKVGDFLWLTLKYDLPEGAALAENPAIDGIENLRVVEQIARKGKIKIRFLVDRLESFETGMIGLAYLDKDGNERLITTGPVAVTVLSNLGEKPQEAALRPIQDIIPAALTWMPFLLWIAVLAVILLCFVICWFWWRRKHRSGRIAIPTVVPPHIRAKKEIDQLVASELFEKGEVKRFYFNFSEIIRRYMESIRHFPAVEMTTEEIVRHVGYNSKDQEIILLLRQADLVKFADTVPTSDRKVQDIQTARIYIHQTSQAQAKAQDIQHEIEVEK